MSGWWWLSFATDEGFLGAAIVPGEGVISATRNAHLLEINPGGEVLGVEVPEGRVPPARWRGRLLDSAEVEEFDREMLAEHGEL